jgi:hypothetical protein
VTQQSHLLWGMSPAVTFLVLLILPISASEGRMSAYRADGRVFSRHEEIGNVNSKACRMNGLFKRRRQGVNSQLSEYIRVIAVSYVLWPSSINTSRYVRVAA